MITHLKNTSMRKSMTVLDDLPKRKLLHKSSLFEIMGMFQLTVKVAKNVEIKPESVSPTFKKNSITTRSLKKQHQIANPHVG